MKTSIQEIAEHPNALAKHYTHFNVANRYLLTGHSHQAWPDIAFIGMHESFTDAAHWVDEKWEKAFEKADLVRKGFATLLDDEDGYIALGSNTHELLIRFLSSLPLKEKPKLITTDGEFHTLRRQLARLEEEGIEVIRIPSRPVGQIAEKVIDACDDRVSAVLLSAVFFDSGLINPGIRDVALHCANRGIELFVDAYHALNVVPFSVKELNLQHAFITGGGYKYCQLGEGNCFLRFPMHYTRRPIVTGWFSEFSLLAGRHGASVEYGQGADLFAGSTYDPVSHYRAASVFQFFEQMELCPSFLRQVSQHQIELLLAEFLNLGLPETIIHAGNQIPLEERAGFLVLYTDHAAKIQQSLQQAGVLTDYRGNALRFGPAPYLSDQQLMDSISILGEVVKGLR